MAKTQGKVQMHIEKKRCCIEKIEHSSYLSKAEGEK